MVASRRRKAMVKLKIIKSCSKSCHLFEFFVINNNAIFCDAFLGSNLEKGLYSNTFFGFTCRSKMIVHAVDKDQTKYFAQS